MGYHSRDRQQTQRRQLILSGGVFFAALLIAGSTAHSRPAFSVDAVEKKLTEDSVLVRTGLKPCANDEALENLAGAQLEQIYASETDHLSARDFTKKSVLHLAKDDCLKDCSCAVRSKIWEKVPEKMKSGVTVNFEETLAKMTDDDYAKCRTQLKNICQQTDIKAFISQVKKAK